jgi:hypothetical protein
LSYCVLHRDVNMEPYPVIILSARVNAFSLKLLQFLVLYWLDGFCPYKHLCNKGLNSGISEETFDSRGIETLLLL